jgi:anaerobic magnesium-protoporphyrin IX monomethyl ester cyclase
MADILLGQAYYLRFDPKLHQAQQPYAPLGTLYAASYLRERGHSATLFDAMLAESTQEWTTALDKTRPRLAAIYEDSFNYLSKMCLLRMREAALDMIDRACAARVPIVVSGSDATDHPELYLRQGAAAVILGEGEITIADLADRLLTQASIENVAGIAYLDDACAVRRTSARPFIKSLDELPFPAWDLVDVDRYRRIWRERHGYHSMNLATTRGCPYHCNWCAKPIYGQRYATRTPGKVVEEIAWLKRRFAPDHLWIVDDVFGLKPGWVEEFAELIDEHDARVPYRCLMRADQVTPSVATALASSGCRMLWMGAESGSQKVLDAMEKGLRVDDIKVANRLLKSEGIGVGVFLQFGYPGETWTDIEATLQLARELEPADIGVSVSYPLPGTGFYERVRQELGAKQNWFDSSDLATMYKATYAPEVYRRVHGLVHHEFRARKSATALTALTRSPWDLRPAHLRRAASWIYNRAALAVTRRQLRPISDHLRQGFGGQAP